MTALRLDLIVRRYHGGVQPRGIKWTWRLWSGSRIVSTSGPQLYSRRIDCARGAEVGAGLMCVVDAARDSPDMAYALRYEPVGKIREVPVRILDQRADA